MSVLRRQESVRRMIQIGIVSLCSRMSYQTPRAVFGILVCVVAMTSIIGVFKSATNVGKGDCKNLRNIVIQSL